MVPDCQPTVATAMLDTVTTRVGVSIVIAGAILLLLRATDLVGGDLFDIVSVLAIVVGALGIAIDGEPSNQVDEP